MKRISSLMLATLVGALLPTSIAHAEGINITVTPWLAPNAYGSPSYTDAIHNAVYAEQHGLTSYGNGGPTQFIAQSNITASQGVVTQYASWMGVADPSGAYANELGNRMAFALAINGNGTQFSISQLSFQTYDPSSAPGTGLNYSLSAGSYNYNDGYVGVQKGADGILGTKDDVLITSGPNTQLVDALYGRGTGVSDAADFAYCTADSQDCTTHDGRQQAIYDVASYYPSTFTGTYSLAGTTATGSGTFNISPDVLAPTPEPSSLALLGTGFAGIVGVARRKLRKA